MEEIIVEIDKGAAKISVKGVEGKGCTALTADIENALGEVKDRATTAEYRQAPQTGAMKARQQ